MKGIRRIISALLVLAMVTGMVPGQVFAEETTATEAVVETTEVTEATTEPVVETTAATEPVAETTVASEEPIAETQVQEEVSSPAVMAAATSGTCGNNLTWSFDQSTGVLSILGSGKMYDDYTGHPWSSHRSKITSIFIEEGVTHIGREAFEYSTNLLNVSIPDSVTSIGKEAFYSCSKLSSILIPDAVTDIGDYAFAYCTSLTSISIPDGVTSINEGLFSNCTNLTLVRIPNNITSIGRYAFSWCSNLAEIPIPTAVSSIGSSAFFCCTSLTSITIPSGVARIEKDTFYDCRSMESIVIPASVAHIGWTAFVICNSLKDIYYGGSEAEWATLLTNAAGNDLLSSDSITVHYNWTNDSANTPSFPTTGTCGDNLTWHFDADTSTLTISGTGKMYDYDNINMPPYVVFISDIRNVVIDEGVTSIGDSAFYLFSDLETITIPNTVTSIGEYAFQFCEGLKKITLPVSVTSIGDHAFSICTGLMNFNVPAQTTTIGSQAFAYTNLKTITIPGTVTSIGQDVFLDANSLTDVFFDGYLSDWEALNVTLAKDVALHYVLNTLQQQWVNEHMDYIFSDDYQQDIISGYNSWMLYIFRKAQDDGGVAAYDLAQGLSKALDLDFTLSGVETYELVLSMILADRSALNTCYETYVESYCNNLAVIGKALKDIGSNKGLPKDVWETIENAYKAMTNSEAGSDAFFDAYAELAKLFDKHFTTEEMKTELKNNRVLEAWGLATDSLFAIYGNVQDVLKYAENYRAYQLTSRYFKQALQTLGVTAYYRYQSDAGPLLDNPFNELGFWKSNLNWSEFQTALNNFIEALDEYETEGADAIASKIVEEVDETGKDILTIVGKFGLEKVLSSIPIVKAIMAAKGVLNIGLLGVAILTNVDDRKTALDMMTKVYCLSVLLDESIDTCANAMSYNNLEASMVFDESVQIYKSAQLIGLDYGIKYAELRLKNAIVDYRLQSADAPEQEVNRLKREINIFTGYIELLNRQHNLMQKISCHDSRLEYIPETDTIVSDFLDARAFVVACPVSVTVTDSQGRQKALLTDNGSQVAEGYELYFRTIPLNDGTGQHIKIAIVPESYSITIEGTDDGKMNAFVTDYTDDPDTIDMYLDVPVKKGSKGSFTQKNNEPKSLELTMGQNTFSPVVSKVQAGDLDFDGALTDADAVYLLWCTMFPEQYPIPAGADFDGSGQVTPADAEYLLWHILFPEVYPL